MNVTSDRLSRTLMASVATDSRTGKKVSITELLITEENEPQLAREISALQAIAHPNVVELVSCHKVENKLWIVTELTQGQLADVIDHSTISLN